MSVRKSRRAAAVAAAGLAAVMGVCALCGCSNAAAEGKEVYTSYVAMETERYSSTAEVVKNVADSVVEIKTESVTTQWGMQYVVSGAGSGVIVAHDDSYDNYLIITNNHVVEGARDITVTLRSGDSYKASLVATDERGDIAVIKIAEEKTLNIARWGDSDALLIGEDLIAIGNPLGNLGGTVTKGILSATERSISVGNYTMTLLQTDTAINPGNSGGGLFDMYGNLVGIVNAKTTDEEVEGICFAIPANTARSIYDDLVTDGVVKGRVTFGVDVATYRESIVYVTKVNDAASGTFEQYDRVVSIGDKQITSLLSYNNALATLKPDDEVQVTVYRGKVVNYGFTSALEFSAQPTTFTVKAKQLSKR